MSVKPSSTDASHESPTSVRPDRDSRHWPRWLLPITSFLALVWFLVRVLPKPSRATYPCQRIAFPLASSFVIWLTGLGASALAWRRARRLWRDRHSLKALGLIVAAALAVFLPLSYHGMPSFGGDGSWYTPGDPPLTPIGTARGLHPGRVVWTYDPAAATWDATAGTWWEHIDQARVDAMLANVLVDLAEAATPADAWDQLFRHLNRTTGKGDIGYQPGETVVVKLNLNMAKSHDYDGNGTFASPQVVLALLRQLVNHAGVDDACVTCFDASRYVPDVIFVRCRAEFPEVRFVDLAGGAGRETAQKDLACPIQWSDDLQDPTEVGGGNPAYLPTCVTQADYFINLANLKGHSLAGVTTCAKNHFGSFLADPSPGGSAQQVPKNAGIHPYVAVHEFGVGLPLWYFPQRPMGTYNALVDLMGHAHLGGKTVLYLIDGLYGANHQNDILQADYRWTSKPFGDHHGWPSSLFASQDPVAIDSVALDFLVAEPTIQEHDNVIDAGDTVDNYLHEAAAAHGPPSGVVYDPEGDGTPLADLGAHEHWNDPLNKQYSGNLKTADGIELIRSPRVWSDINGGGVDIEDLVLLVARWQTTGCGPADQWAGGADINRDGVVNLADYARLVKDWQVYVIE